MIFFERLCRPMCGKALPYRHGSLLTLIPSRLRLEGMRIERGEGATERQSLSAHQAAKPQHNPRPLTQRLPLPDILLVHFILRLGHSHQPLIEPADDVLEALDAMPGLA